VVDVTEALALSWSAALEVAVALAAAVLVLAVPIEKIPSTESVMSLVGAGDRVSRVKLASLAKIAVLVVWIFCRRLMTDVPFGAPASAVKERSNRAAVVLKGIAPVPAVDDPSTIISPAAGKNTTGVPNAAKVEPIWAVELTVNLLGSYAIATWKLLIVIPAVSVTVRSTGTVTT